MMKIKPKSGRQLPAYDEALLQDLLVDEYRASVIEAMWYGYPRNDNRLVVEYVISFYDNDERSRFFRKVRKKDGRWELSKDFRVINYCIGISEPSAVHVADIIAEYMGDEY
jgi:hypothetical protein